MVNNLWNGMLPTPTTNSVVLDGAQLCFNKAHFNREDFNVERFVNLARRRATLDQIHNDLRTYLRFLQHSMINLINDDYADFVNLSSTLAVLKDSIDKISCNSESSWTSFSTSTEEVQKAAQFVQQKCSALSSNRRDQILIRNKIFLFISIERLSKSLRQRPSAISSWLSKLINQVVDVELWSFRIPQDKLPVKAKLAKEACYTHLKTVLVTELMSDLKANCNFLGMLLTLLSLIGQLESAVSEVSTNVIDQKIVCNTGPKDVLLQNLFDQILGLREKWITLLKKQSQLRPDIETFLDNCLLTYCVSFLEEDGVPRLWQFEIGWIKRFDDGKGGTPAAPRGRFEANGLLVVELGQEPRIQKPIRTMTELRRKFEQAFERAIAARLLPGRQWKKRRTERFGSVLVPSDNRLFHRCFSATIEFVQNWPSKNCESTLKSLKNKFNTIVYFKMETQQFLTEVRAHSKPAEFTYSLDQTTKNDCICPLSSTILTAIHKIFSDEIYLASIIDKLWDFTLKCLSNYVDWIKSVNLHFAELSKEEEKVRESKPDEEQWLALVALVWDISNFNSKLLELCSRIVWKRLKDAEVEIIPFEECLTAFGEEIESRKKELTESICGLILAKMIKELAAVGDIPRQYRWTRKPAPTCFSSYLHAAFSVCEVFETKASKIGWNEQQVSKVIKKVVDQSSTVFCEKANQVLDSVEQTGSSLQRFKKKMANENQTDVGDSDEAKIRKQLVYDVNFVKQRVEEHKLNLERLHLLQKRAQEAQ